MLSPLSNPVFRKLFAAQLIALLGTGLTTVALALLAYDLAEGNAGGVLGTALAIKMAAYVTISPIAAAIVQRLPRRIVLVVLDVARAAIVAGLVFVTEVWHIYALILLLQSCSAAFTPAFQATIPDVLPDEATYTRALSLSRFAYDLESLVSPMLAAAALAIMGFSGLFAANAAAFLVSAALILSVTLPTRAPVDHAGGFLDRVSFGIRAYLATPRLRGLLALSLTAAAAGAMVFVNTVVYVQAHLGLDQQHTAFLLAAFGAGSMVVALALPQLLETVSDRRAMLAGSGVMLAGLLVGALLPGFGVIALVWAAIGCGYATVLLPVGRLLRRSSSEADRPAYFAAQFALSHGCWLITYPLAGWLATSYGLAAAFVVLAAVAAGAMALATVLWPATDPLEIEHSHAPLEHTHLHVHDAHHQHPHEGWEGPEPHAHPHSHGPVRHAHHFVIDAHHPHWPRQ